MRRRIILSLLLVAVSCSRPKVEAGLVGTWELDVPNAAGVARWVWEIQAAGLYGFHAEGPGNVPSHSGTFEARDGTYVLHSTTMAWDDTGSYRLISPDTLSATGRLGTASWTRVRPAQAETHDGSPIAPTPPGGNSAKHTATAIYDYLSRHPFDGLVLTSPWALTRSTTVGLDARQRGDGVVGIVRAEVQGPSGPATISLTVYRDRAAAEAASNLDAVFDATTFRMQRGEFVSSHTYDYRDRGEAHCISRLLVGSSSTATVTCYLLVQHPTRQPVRVESEVREPVAAGGQEASMTAVGQANDLLSAGLEAWERAYPGIDGG